MCVCTRDTVFEFCRRDYGGAATIDPKIGSLDALVIIIFSDRTIIPKEQC
jgi:hypothetical protein